MVFKIRITLNINRNSIFKRKVQRVITRSYTKLHAQRQESVALYIRHNHTATGHERRPVTLHIYRRSNKCAPKAQKSILRDHNRSQCSTVYINYARVILAYYNVSPMGVGLPSAAAPPLADSVDVKFSQFIFFNGGIQTLKSTDQFFRV